MDIEYDDIRDEISSMKCVDYNTTVVVVVFGVVFLANGL